MDVASCSSTLSNLTLNPLKTEFNTAALKTFEDIVKTSIGPHGKLKVVQSAAGGHVTVTSSSQRLFNIISIQNKFLKMIVASTKTLLSSYGDYGLSSSFLTTKLINNSYLLTYSHALIGKLYESFGKIFVECLNSDKNLCLRTFDVSNVANFQSVVESILLSKPGCTLRQEDMKHLSLLLIKTFLNCIPSSGPTVCSKNFNIVTLEGVNCAESCIFEGLLIRLSKIYMEPLPLSLEKKTYKVALFTTSLSGDAEFPVDNIKVTDDVDVWEAVLKFLRNVIKTVIESGVHILACQKVIHPSLRKQLEDANILVLDRLGYEVSKNLEYLSGTSNSSLFEEVSYGYLTSMTKKKIGKDEFLLLSNSSKPFWTILICNFNEQADHETKVVCNQAIEALFRLLKKPVVCFGAGCTEIHTSKLVEQKVLETIDDIKQETGCSTSQILETLQIFLQSVVDLTAAFHQDCRVNFVTESLYGHLWKLDEGMFPSKIQRCSCSQFCAANVKDSDWKFLTKWGNSATSEKFDFSAVETVNKIDRSVILDELSAKISAYSTAFETASLLLRVSVFIC